MRFFSKSYICYFIFIIGCSSIESRSYNRVIQGELSFRSGTFQDKSWKDILNFKRTSFYKGATMLYDIAWAKIEPHSPFSLWLDRDRELLSTCQELFAALIYTNDFSLYEKGIGKSAIKEKIKEIGLEEHTATDFHHAISHHFNYDQYGLFKYRTFLYCKPKNKLIPDSFNLNLPGFEQVEFKL